MKGIGIDEAGSLGSAVTIHLDVSAAGLDREVDWHLHQGKRKRRPIKGNRCDADFMGNFAVYISNYGIRRNVKLQPRKNRGFYHDLLRSRELDVHSVCRVQFSHPDLVRQYCSAAFEEIHSDFKNA